MGRIAFPAAEPGRERSAKWYAYLPKHYSNPMISDRSGR